MVSAESNAGYRIIVKRMITDVYAVPRYGNAGQLVVAKRAFADLGNAVGYGYSGQLIATKRFFPDGNNAAWYGYAGEVAFRKHTITNSRYAYPVDGFGNSHRRTPTHIFGDSSASVDFKVACRVLGEYNGTRRRNH